MPCLLPPYVCWQRPQGQKVSLYMGGYPQSGDSLYQHGRPLIPERCFTNLRATLLFVNQNQNITLSLPRELLKRVKRLAADRDTSVSSLMTEALTRLTDETRRYSAAHRRSLAALRSSGSRGTGGCRTWSRVELHER